jgi:predicted ArsR family transcriptional regulator
VTLPPRRYALVADVLADALERAAFSPAPLSPALESAARAAGTRLAGEHRGGDVLGVLGVLGYEPRVEASHVELGNCPYQAIATRHTALVCGMNAALVDDLVSTLEPGGSARLDPAPGRCCVVVDLPAVANA